MRNLIINTKAGMKAGNKNDLDMVCTSNLASDERAEDTVTHLHDFRNYSLIKMILQCWSCVISLQHFLFFILSE